MKSEAGKEEKMLKSYNEEFYTSLKTIKFIEKPLPQEDKLFYHFEQNENASVSTTTGQLLSTYDELVATNESIKKSMISLHKDIAELKENLAIFDQGIDSQYHPEIENLAKALNNYVVTQKEENLKIKKEIQLLEKDKSEIQIAIYNALGYLYQLERKVGIKAKTYTYIYDQALSENELNSKFIIEKVDL